MLRTLLPALALSALLAGPAAAATETWQIDAAHTEVGFKVQHMMVSWTKGKFEKFSGTVRVQDGDPTRAPLIDIEIDPASINTNNEKRDGHLRSADFFDVKKFPKMSFTARRAKRTGKGTFDLIGLLTMHGVTQPVTLKVEGFDREVASPFGGKVMGGTATATLDRKDFGLTWNKGIEAGGVLVGDKVKIHLEIELVKPPAKKSAMK